MAKKTASLKKATAAPAARGIKSLSPAARDSRGYKEIEENKLERFPNRNRRRAYTVEFTCPLTYEELWAQLKKNEMTPEPVRGAR